MSYKWDEKSTRKYQARFSVSEWISFRERLKNLKEKGDISQRDIAILEELIIEMKTTAQLAYLARHDDNYSWLKSNQGKPISTRRIQQILCEHFPEFHLWITHSGTKKEYVRRIRTEQRNIKLKTIENARCGRCGQTNNLELHHMIPISIGGGNDERNLIYLCKECHQLQTNYFMELIRDKANQYSAK